MYIVPCPGLDQCRLRGGGNNLSVCTGSQGGDQVCPGIAVSPCRVYAVHGARQAVLAACNSCGRTLLYAYISRLLALPRDPDGGESALVVLLVPVIDAAHLQHGGNDLERCIAHVSAGGH